MGSNDGGGCGFIHSEYKGPEAKREPGQRKEGVGEWQEDHVNRVEASPASPGKD